MNNNIHIKVFLWDEEIGRLAWNDVNRAAVFMFNPQYASKDIDLSGISLSLKGRSPLLPVQAEDGKIYKQLPAFLADSLPDAWGETLFEQWCSQNHIRKATITPLEKLSYIGKRGMGALEFVPEIPMRKSENINIAALAALAEKVYKDRDAVQIGNEEVATMETLRQFGSPPGGRMGKIVVEVDKVTGSIVSGQTGSHGNHDHFILKFGCREESSAEIEMAYHEMCLAAGMQMTESRLMEVDGTKHFLTKRFDRKDGKKLHMQTLAAMDPDVHSYEGLMNCAGGFP